MGLISFGVYVIYYTWSLQRQILIAETRWVLIALYNIVLNLTAVIPVAILYKGSEETTAGLMSISLIFSGGGIVFAFLLPRTVKKLRGTLHHHDSHNDQVVLSAKVRSPKSKEEHSRTPDDFSHHRLENQATNTEITEKSSPGKSLTASVTQSPVVIRRSLNVPPADATEIIVMEDESRDRTLTGAEDDSRIRRYTGIQRLEDQNEIDPLFMTRGSRSFQTRSHSFITNVPGVVRSKHSPLSLSPPTPEYQILLMDKRSPPETPTDLTWSNNPLSQHTPLDINLDDSSPGQSSPL